MNKLVLKNYQGHVDTTIVLGKTLTTLTGSTNAGKSTIPRAIRFVNNNKPSGTNFIHKNTQCASVIIDDSIEHHRTLMQNWYVTPDGTPEGKIHKALRTNVPEEVTNALKLGEVNFQAQHDPLFLISQTPGKRAQELSTLIDLESAHKALKYLSSTKAKAKANIDVTLKSIDIKNAEVEALAGIHEADKALNKLEVKEAAITKLTTEVDTIKRALHEVQAAKKVISELPDDSALPDLQALIQAHQSYNNDVNDLYELQKVITAIKAAREQLQWNPNKLINKLKAFMKLNNEYKKIKASVASVEICREKVRTSKEEEAAAQAEIEAYKGSECPLCGGTL